MKTHYEDILIKKETAERLASLGYVAAGLAHEIKNPLVSIKTLAQLLPERFDDAEFREQFTSIAISEIDRIGSIVSDLLDFAKSSEPKFAQVDIRKLIDEVILLLSVRTTEIGRASCRERVYISVVAVSLKKKKALEWGLGQQKLDNGIFSQPCVHAKHE